MAAKKKSSPAKRKPQTKPAAKPAPTKPAKKAASKPAKAARPAAKQAASQPAKKASPAATPAKLMTAAKAMKAAKPVAAKPAKAAAAGSALDAGSAAPAFTLSDENGKPVSSAALAGKPYLLYFYPKDDTPGCTKEACDVRDNFGRFGKQGLRVLGVSPDSSQSHAKFGKKYGLPFTLLSDPDKTLASAYGVWGPKKNYGKEYMGIIRSSFLVGADGLVKKAYRGVRVDGHVATVLEDAASLL